MLLDLLRVVGALLGVGERVARDDVVAGRDAADERRMADVDAGVEQGDADAAPVHAGQADAQVARGTAPPDTAAG